MVGSVAFKIPTPIAQLSPGAPAAPLVEARIHDIGDLQAIPNTFTQLPSIRSWSSFRDSAYNDGENLSTSVCRTSSQASSTYSQQDAQRGSTTSSFHIEKTCRKGSNVTVFPHFTSSINKPELKTKAKSLTKRYHEHCIEDKAVIPKISKGSTQAFRTARDIYEIGPKGEGQELWASYKRFRRDKRLKAQHKQENPILDQREEYATARPVRTSPEQTDRAGPSTSLRSRQHPVPRWPLKSVSFRDRELRFGTGDNSGGNSSMSATSYEVPIRMAQIVDANKPLPPIPQLKPVPKSRPTRPARPEHGLSMVGTVAPDTLYPTHGRGAPSRFAADVHKSKDNNKSTPWWKPLTKRDKTEARVDLKSKISRPVFVEHQLHAVDMAVQHGKTHGPSSIPPNIDDKIRHSPTIDPASLNPHQKGKQKARLEISIPLSNYKSNPTRPSGSTSKSTKRSFFTNRTRSDFDTSFACAGVSSSYQPFVQDPGPSTQFVNRLGGGIGELVPSPLFSGNTGEGGGERDSRFYEAYYEVLDAY